eukprot:3241218-Pyramimonas_sp.AAC.1
MELSDESEGRDVEHVVYSDVFLARPRWRALVVATLSKYLLPGARRDWCALSRPSIRPKYCPACVS